MAVIARLGAGVQAQRGYLFPFAPVALGIGIALYFAAAKEPEAVALWALAASCAMFVTLAFRQRDGLGPVFVALALICAGVLLAAYRAREVAAPVLEHRFYGAVEGRVVGIDRSASDKLRLTLDQVVIEGIEPDETPAYVRISLHGEQSQIRPVPGMVIMATANLSPPEGPVEPGAFDYRRQAWFDRLGALGYTRKPVLELAPPEPGFSLALFHLRMRLSSAIQAGMPGQEGAFAAAMMTGDRSGMLEATTEQLRLSNLAHLISISGLHMVLLCGTVFSALRFGLALVPALRRRDPKRLAAPFAIAAGFFYLALSGFEVPTERAFIMVAVALGAVLLGRRAISLRGLAIAAMIVLIRQPESLTEPGFQMSFAATLLLVVTFQWLDKRRLQRLPAFLRPAATLLLSSLVAGVATAPFAAAHFNRISEYGLIANLIAVPAMSLWFMPCALVWAVLYPLGLGDLVLWVMRPSLWWVLEVSEVISSLPNPVRLVLAPPIAVVPLIALGGLWACLWQGRRRVRALGFVPVLAALVLWNTVLRPPGLVSADGALIGILGPEGRGLSKPKGQGFAAESWLENDGDKVDQETAAAREMPRLEPAIYRLGSVRVAVLAGKKAAAQLASACGAADLVILSEALPKGFSGPCVALGKWEMADRGALALWPEGDGLRVRPTYSTALRLWEKVH